MYTLIEVYWKPILSCTSAFVRHFAYFLSHAHIFKLTKHSFPEFHSGLIWIQTLFANVNRERKRERLVHAHPFRKIEVHRQIDKETDTERERETERETERDVCSFFNFIIFLTLRTCLRISKFRVYLCKKFWSMRLHYKLHLRRWRASESVLVFLKEERKCSDSSVVRG